MADLPLHPFGSSLSNPFCFRVLSSRFCRRIGRSVGRSVKLGTSQVLTSHLGTGSQIGFWCLRSRVRLPSEVPRRSPRFLNGVWERPMPRNELDDKWLVRSRQPPKVWKGPMALRATTPPSLGPATTPSVFYRKLSARNCKTQFWITHRFSKIRLVARIHRFEIIRAC